MDAVTNISTETNFDTFPAFVQEMREILLKMEILLQETGPVEETSEYESCLKIKGRSILPPLMTLERKKECIQLKEQALEVERQLAERRIKTVVEDITTNLSDSSLTTPVKKVSVKLRAGSVESVKSIVDLGSQYDSLSSQPTVLENRVGTAFTPLPDVEDNGSEISSDEAFTSPGEMRDRKGSYTLSHPSPVLLAYAKQSGKRLSDLQFPRPRSVLDRPEKDDHSNRQQIQSYLEELARMPGKSPRGKKPSQNSREVKSSAVNTSPVNVPNNDDLSIHVEANSSKPDQRNDKIITSGDIVLSGVTTQSSLDPASQTHLSTQTVTPKAKHVQALFLGSDSENDSINTEDPQSLITQRTTPGIPSLMTDNITPEPSQLQSHKENQPSAYEVFEDYRNLPSITVSQVPPTKPSSNIVDVSAEMSLDQSMSLHFDEDPREKTNHTQKLQNAISSLAMQQKSAIQELLNQQAREREELEKLFASQQQELIQAIMTQISQASSTHSEVPKFEYKNTTPDSTKLNAGRLSPLIPTLASKVRPPEEKLKQLPPNFTVPEVAHTPEMKCHFEKLSALIKGHLTRRLLRTERVQRIISSMRDTMTIALQLHKEARKALVSMQDIELHRRLLQQIFKDSQSVHSIFFEIPTAQRIAIIRQDRELKEERLRRGEDISPRTQLSAVTRARMQQRKQIQALLMKTEESYKSSNPTKRRSKNYDKPWKARQIYDVEAYAQNGNQISNQPPRRSLNLNVDENRLMTRSLMSNNKSRKTNRMTRSFSPGAPLTVIHNKPWK